MTGRFHIMTVMLCALAGPAVAAGPDVVRINGDDARTFFGPGTGIKIGIIDSGVDPTHPALSGTVTGGLPRLVSQANFVPTEPGNTGQDIVGHGTAVAGCILSRDATFFGVATDARYINARVLDSNNVYDDEHTVANGTCFALASGANLLNLSLGNFGGNTSGNSHLSLMCDYISFGLRVPITISAGNDGNTGNPRPRGPGDAFNVFSVGATEYSAYSKVVNFSSYGPTTDLRSKPDLVAPGDLINVPNTNWETEPDFFTWGGTSFAAPNVAGILAAQMQYGADHGLSRDPLVLKATMLNSAEKVNDRVNAPWAPGAATTTAGVFEATRPINRSAGAGQVDGMRLYQQYSVGEHEAGAVPALGWDFDAATGVTQIDYHLGALVAGTSLTATLAWYRHVAWIDDGNDVLDGNDSFSALVPLENLNFQVYRDDVLIAQSVSGADNLEHLYLANVLAGEYLLRVLKATGADTTEEYAFAWFGTGVPEPAMLAPLCLAALCAARSHRRKISPREDDAG
ncbi:MAG: S8 family peptidase [Tepidisphaeraceae bacterium]